MFRIGVDGAVRQLAQTLRAGMFSDVEVRRSAISRPRAQRPAPERGVAAETQVEQMRAVILAGGKGTRLRPYTTVLPKPLVPVADRPILELVLRQLGPERLHPGGPVGRSSRRPDQGLPGQHRAAEGHGASYVWEDAPLGTAGALTMLEDLDEPFLAMNGDVLTTLDYAQLMRFHRGHEGGITIATHRKNVDIDLGVIESDDGFVKEYIEKPTMRFDVSMGVYVYDPDVVGDPAAYFDFPDVVNAMLEAWRKVAVYSGPGVWFDIGTVGEHERRPPRSRPTPRSSSMPDWRVPLADVEIGEDEIAAVADTYRSGWLSMGPRTVELEERFAEYTGLGNDRRRPTHGRPPPDLPCGGSRARRRGRGPALTFVATANAIRYTGATPVFADVSHWTVPGSRPIRPRPRSRRAPGRS